MDQTPNQPPSDGREPERRSPPWLVIVLPVVWLVLGLGAGIAIIGWVGAGDDSASTADVSSQGPSTGASATAKTKKSATSQKTAAPEPTAEPTTEPAPEPTASRSIGVSVYNQVGIGGLARRVAGELQAAGWTIGAVADWRGSVPQDTIYFPVGQQAEGELLGQDLAITRILPAVQNMSTTQLTVVLASPR